MAATGAGSSTLSLPELQRQLGELADELRARTEAEGFAVQREEAFADILSAINSAKGDVSVVFGVMIERATKLCSAAYGYVWLYDGETARPAASYAQQPFGDWLRARESVPSEITPLGQTLLHNRLVHVVDATEHEGYRAHAGFRELVDRGGVRTLLHVPLCKDEELLGVITVYRQERHPFSDRQISLMQSFAAQAVIAIENARLLNEQREALEQQAATTEVLQVINSSPGRLEPVFNVMLEKAMALCGAAFGFLTAYDGQRFSPVAMRGVPPSLAEYFSQGMDQPSPGEAHYRILQGEDVIHNLDQKAEEAYQAGLPLRRAVVDLGGARSALVVALRKDDAVLGALTIYRKEVRPFSDKEIELMRNFAAQAVIAIENARLMNETRDALERQTATSDVLKVINSSPGNLAPVFDTMLERAVRLSESAFGMMNVYENNRFKRVALRGVPQSLIEQEPSLPAPGPNNALTRLANGEDVVHIEDLGESPSYREGDLRSRGMVELAGARSLLAVALRKDGVLLGTLTAYRQEVRPFSPKQIELLQGFAAQAVIAMENARLLEELRDRQAELRVTFDNMGDGVAMFDGDHRLAAWNRNFETMMGLPEDWLRARPTYPQYLRFLAERGEFGTEDVEAALASRLTDTARELRLERTREDGSVIEVRRNAVPGGGFVLIYSDISERRRAEAAIRAARDAAEAALERQTATADILKVIAGSPTDVQPVLDALVRAAVGFCGATDATISLRVGNEIVRKAHHGPLAAKIGEHRPIDGDSASARAIRSGRTVHYQDIHALDPVEFAGAHRRATHDGYRATLAAPMLRDGVAIGNIALRKVEPGAFTPEQIDLLETFAAQAVIAIENVRLFNDLREALEQQTATSDILRVISQSPTDVTPVLTAVAKAALKFCGARDAQVALRNGDAWSVVAHEGPIGALSGRRRLTRETAPGRAMMDGELVQIPDLQSAEADEFQEARELGRRLGFRSALAAPLLRDDVAIGAISLRRPEAGLFTPNQVELLKSFAAQAVIAIENVRLFTELRESLDRLTAAQANLIQAEKMASLGQLTAGIAHEIKNPLNFINNFSGLSSELLDELKGAVTALLDDPDDEKRAELQETMDLLTGNLARIVEHGKRADGIVKSMLSHSRGGTGDWQKSNINALVEEALNLAYHGARAQDKDFNITLTRDLAPEMNVIEVVPQDVTRVFLNLFGNAFYATRKRGLDRADSGYRPTLSVSTRDLGEAVEIRVRDNGTGIQPEVRAKLFQPFFTTKPTGEGTGLGLSISYDIVTQQHGGTVEVESEPGSFTEFIVRLPRNRRPAQSRATA
jgi:PAS domain S-box-containing protein